ncbi:MAG: nitrogen fixation protein NifQ [Methylocystis sp.]
MARVFPDLETSGDACLPTATDQSVSAAARAYRVLTGVLPEAAITEEGAAFDRHVLASIIALASTESGGLPARTGLSAADLEDVSARGFPGLKILGSCQVGPSLIDTDEMEVVRDLFLANRSSEGDCGRWFAAMMARRALEPNHLWEDLGLRERSELTRLISRHFAPLAVRNDKNMRWKRFIYRMMCEDDGFVMCSSPVCSNCADYSLCFGAETGTSRVASAARAPGTTAV